MNPSELYLICFVVGGLWSAMSVLGAAGLFPHWHFGHLHSGHAHGHGSFWLHPSGLAIFCAWFGAAGYLLTRHTLLGALLTLLVSCVLGLIGMLLLGLFLRWLAKAEKPMDPADYRVAGIFGKVSSPIRADGVGEIIYLRDGARKLLPARSDTGCAIARGDEVIVTRYEKGIAYVRIWEELQ